MGISIMSAAWRGSSRRSGAPVLVGAGAVDVIRTGKDDPRDPQAGLHDPMEPVTGAIRAVADGEQVAIAGVQIAASPHRAHHRCDELAVGKAARMVPASPSSTPNSLSPVSADEYRFTDHPDYVAMFRGGSRLAGLECDMLLTPHPSASGMISRAAEDRSKAG